MTMSLYRKLECDLTPVDKSTLARITGLFHFRFIIRFIILDCFCSHKFIAYIAATCDSTAHRTQKTNRLNVTTYDEIGYALSVAAAFDAHRHLEEPFVKLPVGKSFYGLFIVFQLYCRQ